MLGSGGRAGNEAGSHCPREEGERTVEKLAGRELTGDGEIVSVGGRQLVSHERLL